MKIKLNKTRFKYSDIKYMPERVQKAVCRQLARNKNSTSHANLEPPSSPRPLETKKNPRYDTPCRISIHHIRKRLADIDNLSGKACIDGLVQAGIFKDDSTKWVTEVRTTQEKGKPEETIVTITPIAQQQTKLAL